MICIICKVDNITYIYFITGTNKTTFVLYFCDELKIWKFKRSNNTSISVCDLTILTSSHNITNTCSAITLFPHPFLWLSVTPCHFFPICEPSSVSCLPIQVQALGCFLMLITFTANVSHCSCFVYGPFKTHILLFPLPENHLMCMYVHCTCFFL